MHKIAYGGHAGYRQFSMKNDLSLCRHGTVLPHERERQRNDILDKIKRDETKV